VLVAPVDAAVRVRYGAPLVVFTRVKPVRPDWFVKVAPVVLRPAGVVHVPLAIRQYSNFIDPRVPLVGTVKSNLCFTVPPGLEPPSEAPSWRVKLRLVI
jgi:hypothetical protein